MPQSTDVFSLYLMRLRSSVVVLNVSLSVDKVTTDEELEEMLQRDNLAIFISDVSGFSFSSGQHK